MRLLMQAQGLTNRKLDAGNARYEAIRDDFEQFGFRFHATLTANPQNPPRIALLGHLNAWRNYASHQNTTPPLSGGPFTLATVRGWRRACDELAGGFDQILDNQLSVSLGRAPL